MEWLLPLRPADDAGESFEVHPHSAMLGRFGSFLMACAVRAAAATVEGMVLTALRADFLTPPPEGPIRFRVEPTRSGRSVAVRRVVVGLETVHAVMTLSFAAPGPDAAAPVWEPRAEAITENPEEMDRYDAAPAGLSLLDVRTLQASGGGFERRHPFWARPAERFGEGPVAAAAAVVLASDHFVIAMATPVEEGPPSFAVTLDHSVWFHRLTDADEWLRYDAALVVSAGGRAVIKGTVTDRDGRLAASFTQQAMRRGIKTE